jgi:LmbE family N-acetylglucosaminyl deacetylase
MDHGPGSARRLLGVFAHPDDEVLCAGGTMAAAAEAGTEIMLVSATRGERGQIRDPAAATRRTLGAVRAAELRAAAAELGVRHVQVLAYPDGAVARHQSSLGPAIADIVQRFDPDTVITFGPDGGYGHPDHMAISALTTKAFRALIRDHHRRESLTCLVLSRTPVSPYAARGAGAAHAAEPSGGGLPPDTCAVDVTRQLHRKLGALARHRTQYPIAPSMLPQSLLENLLGTEFFLRAGRSSGNAAVSRWTAAQRRRKPEGGSRCASRPRERLPHVQVDQAA